MTDIIQKLSQLTSNQIAAGEVVRRPASVVKELMENSIDAQSTMIIVKIEDGGKELIHIIDDGVGMSYNDAFTAFERHATSKISKTDDIFSLRTFGFRGEALPSIASVAEVELKTCRDEDDMGCRVTISGGDLKKHVKEITTKGTQVIVKKLFFNVPQRRNFLKATSSELKHIIFEFKKIALCNPQISLFLYNNEKCLYNLPIGTLRHRVNNIIGKNINHQLMEINVETSIVTIKGYIGSPETAIQSAEQFMFVNGRFFRTAYFSKAINRAFENILPNNKVSPRYFLYFEVNPAEIDINADPEKVDVKFENEQQIWQILFTSVKAVLGKNGISPTIDFEVGNEAQIDLNETESFKAMAAEVNKDSVEKKYNPFNENFSFSEAIIGNEDNSYKAMDKVSFEKVPESISSSFVSEISEINIPEFLKEDIKINEVSSSFGDLNNIVDNFENSSDEILSSSFSEEYDTQNSEKEVYTTSISFQETQKEYDLTTLGTCTRFDNDYMIAPLGGRLLFIRILSALNRICYEKYESMVSKKQKAVANKLIFPITIPLSVTYRAVIDDSLEDLKNIGFEIQDSETDGAIDVTAIPNGYDKYNLYEVFEDILESISSDDAIGYDDHKRDLLVKRLSSIEAIKRSKSLVKEEFPKVLEELFNCNNYRYSPKGRLIFVEIERFRIDELLK